MIFRVHQMLPVSSGRAYIRKPAEAGLILVVGILGSHDVNLIRPNGFIPSNGVGKPPYIPHLPNPPFDAWMRLHGNDVGWLEGRLLGLEATSVRSIENRSTEIL